MGALAADRKALAVTQTAVAGQVHEPLDVHRGLATKVALDGKVAVDRFADVQDFLIGEVLDPAVGSDPELGRDLLGRGMTNAVDVGQRDFDALVSRDIDAGNACHSVSFFSSTGVGLAGG